MKVTARELSGAMLETLGDKYEVDKWDKAMDTPIVPRKMVVMIMEQCMKDYDVYGKESFAGREALSIAEYAHELLKKFEGDTDAD